MAHRKICTIAFVCLCILLIAGTAIWYLLHAPDDDQKQIEFMKNDLKGYLKFWIDWGNPSSLDRYLVPRMKAALGFLANAETLEKPYLFGCYLGCKQHKPCTGSAGFGIRWLEIGFQSAGIQIEYSRNGGTEIVGVPFPSHIWNDRAREHYEKQAQRVLGASVTITDAGILMEFAGERGAARVTHTLPLSVISDPAYVTLYDNDGKKSEPLELHISPEVREFILLQDEK